MINKDQNKKFLLEKFSSNLISFQDKYDQINTETNTIFQVIQDLKEDKNLQYDQLIDLTAIDYPSREKRFEIVYILLSMTQNKRIVVKASLRENENTLKGRGLASAAATN